MLLTKQVKATAFPLRLSPPLQSRTCLRRYVDERVRINYEKI
jgi:hypothetical protein